MKHYYSLVFLTVLFTLPAFAQFREAYPEVPHEGDIISAHPVPYESDIISARPVRYFLGVPLGILAYQHQGSFSPLCPCEFKDASAIRIFPGLEFSVQFPKLGFALKAMVSYQDFSADFTNNYSRATIIAQQIGDTVLDYHASSKVVLHYLSLQPSIAWYIPYTSLFLQAGFDIGYPLKYTYDHKESIVSEGWYVYDNFSRENVLLDEQNIPDGNSLRFGLAFGLGGDIFVTPMFYLTPQVGLTIPLTQVSNRLSRDNWKIMSEYAVLILKFRL